MLLIFLKSVCLLLACELCRNFMDRKYVNIENFTKTWKMVVKSTTSCSMSTNLRSQGKIIMQFAKVLIKTAFCFVEFATWKTWRHEGERHFDAEGSRNLWWAIYERLIHRAPKFSTINEEAWIVNWIQQCAERGFLRSRRDIMLEVLELNQLKLGDPAEQKFDNSFKRRHRLKIGITEGLLRASGNITKSNIGRWFRMVKEG